MNVGAILNWGHTQKNRNWKEISILLSLTLNPDVICSSTVLEALLTLSIYPVLNWMSIPRVIDIKQLRDSNLTVQIEMYRIYI